MLTMNWPWWLVLVIFGVEGWPFVLTAGLGLAVLAALTRGWVRATAIVLLLPCAAITCIAAVVSHHVMDTTGQIRFR